MEKEQFVSLVNALVVDLERQKQLSDLGIDIELSESYGAIEEYLESVLDLHPDECYGDDLSYFLYEADCGNKWRPGMITIQGKDMPLRDVEDLWKLITFSQFEPSVGGKKSNEPQ